MRTGTGRIAIWERTRPNVNVGQNLVSYLDYCHEFLNVSSLYRLQGRHGRADEWDDALAALLPSLPERWGDAFRARVRLRDHVVRYVGGRRERGVRASELRRATRLPLSHGEGDVRRVPTEPDQCLSLDGMDQRSGKTSFAEDTAGNFVSKIPVTPAQVDGERYGSVLDIMGYWKSMPRFGDVFPRIRWIDPLRLMRSGAAGYVHVMDVASADPREFFIEVYGSKAVLNGACDLTGTLVDHATVAVNSRSVMTEYDTVKRLGTPRLQWVNAFLSGDFRSYLRLIAPLSTDGRVCDKLLVAVQYAEG